MASMEMLMEADRRGILPPDKKALLDEAISRGLPAQEQAPPKRTHREAEDANPLPGPSFLQRLNTRDTYAGVGGTIGGLGGATLGAASPIPGGAAIGGLGGGAGGAAVGSLFYDLVNPGKTEGMFGPTMEALGQAKQDAMWGGGANIAGNIAGRAWKGGMSKLLGVGGEESKRLAEEAERQGIDLGIVHVSKAPFVRGAPGVVGVFPFIGAPVRQGQARIVGQLDDRAASLLNDMAPTSTRQEVGSSLTKAAEIRYDKFNTIKSTLYKRFEDLAGKLDDPNIVRTDPIRDALSDIKARQAKETVPLGYPIKEPGQKLEPFKGDPLGEFLDQLERLPSNISIEEARGLQKTLNKASSRARPEGIDVERISQMAAAVKEAINAPDLSRAAPEEAKAVVEALNRANTFFNQTSKRFETPTAQKFGRVDKNIFEPGFFKPGTINSDEVFNAVYKANSPEALDDLRKLVGPAQFQNASRAYLDKQLKASIVTTKEGSLVGDTVSAAKFEKNMGLDTPEGKKSFEAILKGSPVKMKDWEDFLSVAIKATDITVADPSKFLVRRLILGGSLAGGLTGGIAVDGGVASIPVAVISTLAMRQGSKYLMSPFKLKQLTAVLNDTATDQQKRALIGRLLEPYGE